MTFILVLDQGTSSSRAMVFDGERRVIAGAARRLRSAFPRSGWVEQDPEDIWRTSAVAMRKALSAAGIDGSRIAALGITNQRETVIVWERATGRAVANAIVWQDRRTDGTTRRLADEGHGPMIAERTGLVPDPYFSGTKIAWILDHVDGARERARRGELLAGTVDSFLVWRLTDGAVHATDATNASRTMLYDIRRGRWDEDLCRLLRVPEAMLPEVRDSAGAFGTDSLTGAPVLGVAGDQQAAAIGQACFTPGMIKATYGTGCFVLLNIGAEPVVSANRLLTTIAWQLDGRPAYALEGSIFNAGTVVEWLRDGPGLIGDAGETAALAAAADPGEPVYLVPAFTGLGAPWWDSRCRGSIHGLTRATGRAELVRAALESVAFQTRDLIGAMQGDWRGAGRDAVLRVDGGMSANDFAMQCLADILALPVDRMASTQATALGAAWLAGHRAGLWPDADTFARSWQGDARFVPQLDRGLADERYRGWREAVRRTLVAEEPASRP